MRENEEQDVLVTRAEAPAEPAAVRFDRERLSRRQALKRFGITTGMATFAMFSADDLARMVGQALQQRAGDSQIANQIAREFQQAGVVMAATQAGANGAPGGGPCITPSGCDCQCQCERQKTADDANCYKQFGGGWCFRGNPFCPALNACLDATPTARTNCYSNCLSGC